MLDQRLADRFHIVGRTDLWGVLVLRHLKKNDQEFVRNALGISDRFQNLLQWTVEIEAHILGEPEVHCRFARVVGIGFVRLRPKQKLPILVLLKDPFIGSANLVAQSGFCGFQLVKAVFDLLLCRFDPLGGSVDQGFVPQFGCGQRQCVDTVENLFDRLVVGVREAIDVVRLFNHDLGLHKASVERLGIKRVPRNEHVGRFGHQKIGMVGMVDNAGNKKFFVQKIFRTIPRRIGQFEPIADVKTVFGRERFFDRTLRRSCRKPPFHKLGFVDPFGQRKYADVAGIAPGSGAGLNDAGRLCVGDAFDLLDALQILFGKKEGGNDFDVAEIEIVIAIRSVLPHPVRRIINSQISGHAHNGDQYDRAKRDPLFPDVPKTVFSLRSLHRRYQTSSSA